MTNLRIHQTALRLPSAGMDAVNQAEFAFSELSRAHEQLNAYWNIYSVVVFGIVGLLYGLPREVAQRVRWAVTIAFLVWAAANGWAIFRQQTLYSKLASSLRQAEREMPPLVRAYAGALRPASPYSAVTFHLVLDGLVLIAIWIPAWREKRGATESIATILSQRFGRLPP